MDFQSAKNFLSRHGQMHLLDYYEELTDEQRGILLNEIEKLNISVVENINSNAEERTGNLSPIPARSLDDIAINKKSYEEAGLKLLRENKVGAVLLAGGQGTRLGFDKPKGTFNIGITRKLSIFEQQMNNIKDVTSLAGRCFPLFIMTSDKNNGDTIAFFKENNYFGYPEDKIHFFIQDTEPACGFDGKIFLSEKHRIALSPNGNGGWYSSLISSGLDKVIRKEGIEWLNVYGVDNVLQRICDPAFLGATYLSGCACSSKVVKKTCAEEKVGVLCQQNGKPCIVEYYEMPAELASLRGGDGELVYRYGVILNYLFNVGALDRTLSNKLPYHLAKKAVKHIKDGKLVEPTQPNGYKFETLVVDMVKMMGSCLAYEVEREREFAPVKNKAGADSVESARALLIKNGVSL